MRAFYIPKNSRVHGLLPSTKVAVFLSATYVAYLLPEWHQTLILWAVVYLPGAAASRIFKEFFRLTVTRILPFIALVVGMGLLVLLPSAWLGEAYRVQGLEPTEIIKYSATMASRIFLLLTGFLLFIQTTSPSKLVAELMGWGVSPQMAHLLGSGFQLAEEVRRRSARIIEAQTARGIEWSGNIFMRLRLLPILVGPLIQGSLAEIELRAVVMLTRGYGLNGPRTFVAEIKRRFIDNLLLGVALTAAIGITAWRALL